MRVVQMIDTLETGGAQQLLVTYAQVARQHQQDATIVSLREGDSPFGTLLRNLGASVVAFPAGWMFAPRRLWRLAAFVRHGHYQVIHAHLGYAIILAAVLGKLMRIPVVASLHSVGKEPPRRFDAIRRRMEKWALRYGAQRVIAVGEAVAEAHSDEVAPGRMVVIPNAILSAGDLPAEKRRALRVDMVGDPALRIIISVGRLTAEKGFDDLLRALAQMRADYPSLAVVIVGRGAVYQKLQALIDELGLQGRAFLLGERHDVPELLVASDMFVLASYREGLSLSVLEAMAAGLPVVATDVGETARIVGHDAGLVVPPGEPAVLAQAIASVLDNWELARQWGRAGKQRVDADYSPEVWFDRLMTVYRQTALNQTSGPAAATAGDLYAGGSKT